MKADGKYRFNLQFPAETMEQMQVGELLERAGNRKSMVVVEALSAYIAEHPEVLEPESKIEIHSAYRFDKEEIRQLIREMVKEHFASSHDADAQIASSQKDDMEDDISEMLDNLELFR